MNHRIESVIAHALRERGGRVTPQRLAIARVVGDLDGHATADEIFDELSERLPGVSMPTVYATLELLEELGQVRRVAAGSGAIIFDSRIDAHDHMICRGCGRATDLDAGLDREAALATAAATGFAAEDAQLVIQGVCAACRAEPTASAG